MGEICLLETLLEDESPHELVIIALDKRFRISDLKDYPVVKEGKWESTEKSTISCPIIYLNKGSDSLVILKRPEDKKYKLAKYRILL